MRQDFILSKMTAVPRAGVGLCVLDISGVWVLGDADKGVPESNWNVRVSISTPMSVLTALWVSCIGVWNGFAFGVGFAADILVAGLRPFLGLFAGFVR